MVDQPPPDQTDDSPITLLLQNARLLPRPGAGSRPSPPSFLAVAKNRIKSMGPMAQCPRTDPKTTVMDVAGNLVLPGLVNGHCHAAMTLFRGLADDLPLMTWLQEHIFPAEARHVNEEMVYWCSQLAAAEMLLSGTTTVADSYFLEHQVVRAFTAAGLRAICAQGVIDFPAPGVANPKENIQQAAGFIDLCQGGDSLVLPAVFCHSPYTCSPETLVAAKELARRQSIPFFIHAAETEAEQLTISDRYGLSPIAHLHKLGLLDHNTICVHCVHCDHHDVELLAQSGAAVVTCPESNMKLASGCAPLPALLSAGIPVALGTDGCASNNDLDLFREMDVCAKLHKLHNMDPTVVPAAAVLDMATLGGARALGLDGAIGSLAPGKKADLVVVDGHCPHLTPMFNENLLVYSAHGADVRSVIVNGRLVVDNRRLLTIDLDEVLARVNDLAAGLAPR